MPEICRFYGIIIQMFFKDHNPPHFHIEYGEYKAVINIDKEIVKGLMPKRALNLVFEWMDFHKSELMDNWVLVQKGKTPKKIEPLK